MVAIVFSGAKKGQKDQRGMGMILALRAVAELHCSISTRRNEQRKMLSRASNSRQRKARKVLYSQSRTVRTFSSCQNKTLFYKIDYIKPKSIFPCEESISRSAKKLRKFINKNKA